MKLTTGSVVLAAIIICGKVFAQSPGFQSPSSGFIFDESMSAIRPIGGFPGATLLGDPIIAAEAIKKMRFAPGQSCAVGLDADGRVYVMNTDAGSVRGSLLENAVAQPSAVHFNRTGSAAVLFYNMGNRFQVVTGLPLQPKVSETFELPDLGGEASAFALNDSGDKLAIGVTGQSRGAVYVVETKAGQALQPAFIASAGGPSGLAFSANATNLAVADKVANSVFIIRDVDNVPTTLPIASEGDGIAEPSAVEFFDDATLLIANGASTDLLVARLAVDSSVMLEKLPVPSAIKRLDRLSASKVFLLTPVSTEQLALLDMSEQPKVFFIPVSEAARGN